jgi:photosystem II stability/assembly factor-like uncharacterized protein
VAVIVTTPGGTSPTVGGDQFTYMGPPTVTALFPSHGWQFGETSVNIDGTGFTGATSVHFGSAPAVSFTVTNDNEISAVAPPGTGTVDVSVTTPYGTSATGSSGDQFTYDTSGPNLTGVSCPQSPTGNNHCFAVGNTTVIATTDAGSTWSQVASSQNGLQGISCPTSTQCITVGIATIMRYDGSSWSTVLSPGNQLNSVSCPTTSFCMTVGTNGVLKSIDGGQTWTSQGLPSGNSLNGVSCVTSQQCVAVGNDDIERTVNGGATWTSESIPSNIPGVSHGDLIGLTAVSCADLSHCVTVGYDPTASRTVLLSSTDGGTSWAGTGAPTVAALYSVRCYDSLYCVAVGQGGAIDTTGDGGATWQSTPQNTNDLHGVDYADATHIVAVGDGGTIVLKYLPRS